MNKVAHRLIRVLIVAAVAGMAGCATVITVPTVIGKSATVFLLDQGHHSSLVLPMPGHHMARFSYGDWDYYALADTGVYQGASALLWPTQGALGYRGLPGPPTAASVRAQVAVPIVHIYPLRVEQIRVERLRHRLMALYHANVDTRVYNPRYDLYFVHDPQGYDIFHDSNHEVARWLERLGCEVRGPALLSNWKIETPDRH